MLLFKKSLINLIQGIRSVSKDGITVHPPNIELQIDERKKHNINELLAIESSLVSEELEQSIRDALISKDLNVDGDTTTILIKHLAVTQRELDFEKIYSSIFESQIYLLRKINETQGSGRLSEYVDSHFASVKEKFEEFNDWDRDKYCQYLLNNGLLITTDNLFIITVKGNEFLTWLAKRGKIEEKGL